MLFSVKALGSIPGSKRKKIQAFVNIKWGKRGRQVTETE